MDYSIFINHYSLAIALVVAWLFDLWLGDPAWLPHPVVGFGKAIAWCERHFNRGQYRMLKGALVTLLLDALVFLIIMWLVMILSHSLPSMEGSILPLWGGVREGLLFLVEFVIIFYCLARTTLIREVRAVFLALDRSLEEGRKQVARIVGRDTSELSAQEVRTAALETLAENLSDGVIAPLFWLAVGGVPAMLTYKMINTQDSMVGYRTERYKDYGCWAARIDDIANYIPARLTALLMLLVAPLIPTMRGDSSQEERSSLSIFHFSLFIFNCVRKYARNHLSPNSGYPEAALAGILGCRFGGPHNYFGKLVYKPYIGENDRLLTTADMKKAIRVNRMAELLMLLLVVARFLFL
jgi:adenosylcobinamide-phosphate synthase